VLELEKKNRQERRREDIIPQSYLVTDYTEPTKFVVVVASAHRG
jgi:hypothetical protein